MATFTVFSQLFSKRVYPRAIELMAGALLCRKQRTVSSILRALGLAERSDFGKYHRVLNRAKWSPLEAAHLLLNSLIHLTSPDQPLFIAVDEMLERRFGKRISDKGLYHDAARSLPQRKAFCVGLQWISMMLLVSLPFSSRKWALPFFTVLAPSKRSNQQRRRRHKSSLDWTMQMVRRCRRWLGNRAVYLLGDGGFASVLLAHTCRKCNWHLISRIRLDAVLHNFAPLNWNKPGRKPTKGARLTSLAKLAEDPKTPWRRIQLNWYQQGMRTMEYHSGVCLWYRSGEKVLPIRWVLMRSPNSNQKVEAFFSTDTQLHPIKLIEYYFLRWNVEVTFEESRAHLGINTQRQWAPKAIQRTTPALLAMYSLATLAACNMSKTTKIKPYNSAWYQKSELTFSDIITFLRWQIYTKTYFKESEQKPDSPNYHKKLTKILIQQLATAA